MCTLYKNNWNWNETVRQEFVQFSAPLALNIPPAPDVPTNASTHLNWCSGQNMHFDIGMVDPDWTSSTTPNNIYKFAGTASNIMMRYKRVRCNIYGNISITKLNNRCTQPNTTLHHHCECQHNDPAIIPPRITSNITWEGWATTTQFGCGNGPWGGEGQWGSPYNVDIKKINNANVPRMGAAIPWRYYYKWYNGKEGQLEAVGKSAVGNSTVKACFLAQPIRVPPANINGTTDIGSFCTDNCIDINDDNIAATYGNGSMAQQFPKYLIMPFEGCGGDGDRNKGIDDVMNTCTSAITNTTTRIDAVYHGNWSSVCTS